VISRYILLSVLITLFLTIGCQVPSNDTSTETDTPFILTATFPVTFTPMPSGTPPPPPAQPTVAPVEGISSTQINVRSEPSTAASVLGIIPSDTKVEIVGKDPAGNWWQILYAQGVGGRGWVTAQYVTAASTPSVPVVGSDGVDPNSGNVAIIQQQINVRSGPGTGFNSLGTLHAQDVVNVTGKDASGTWLQIAFAAGPDGKGWVNAAFVQANRVENLPIITEAGEVVGTGTPTGIPFTPTSTVLPAWPDDDSSTNPIISVTFEPTGTHALIYSGDVSAPEGDTQDWVQFTPYSRAILLEVTCRGSDLNIELIPNGLTTPQSEGIRCGSEIVIHTEPNLPIKVHFSAQPNGALKYTSYTIHIETIP
jgi:uncharacterized protein YraI